MNGNWSILRSAFPPRYSPFPRAHEGCLEDNRPGDTRIANAVKRFSRSEPWNRSTKRKRVGRGLTCSRCVLVFAVSGCFSALPCRPAISMVGREALACVEDRCRMLDGIRTSMREKASCVGKTDGAATMSRTAEAWGRAGWPWAAESGR
jgi:hypothetical protein